MYLCQSHADTSVDPTSAYMVIRDADAEIRLVEDFLSVCVVLIKSLKNGMVCRNPGTSRLEFA